MSADHVQRPRLRRALGSGGAVGALAVSGLLGAAAPAHAAACDSTASGVTVVVSGPNGTSVRCAPGDPASGAAALAGAGFSITQVQTQPGFVCRINGAPASDPCVRTPPTTAYWSYWYATPGGSWTYSSTGAYSRNPAPGTVEGWSFGSGGPPAVAVPSVSAPAPAPAPKPSTSTTAPKPPAPKSSTSTTAPKPPAPKPSTSAPSSATQSSSTPSSAPQSTATQSPSGSQAPGTPASQAPTSGTETAAPTQTPSLTETTASSPPDRPVEPEPTPSAASAEAAGQSPTDTSGPSTPTLAGLGMAGALLGAAGWMGWRRRTES